MKKINKILEAMNMGYKLEEHNGEIVMVGHATKQVQPNLFEHLKEE